MTTQQMTREQVVEWLRLLDKRFEECGYTPLGATIDGGLSSRAIIAAALSHLTEAGARMPDECTTTGCPPNTVCDYCQTDQFAPAEAGAGEAVAWQYKVNASQDHWSLTDNESWARQMGFEVRPLYAHPPGPKGAHSEWQAMARVDEAINAWFEGETLAADDYRSESERAILESWRRRMRAALTAALAPAPPKESQS